MINAKSMIKYQKHVFTNLEETVFDLDKSTSKDSKMMYNALKPIIIKLQNYGIHKLNDIAMIFKDCGFNNKSTNQIIVFLLNAFKITRFSKRDIGKFNKTYRNIILNLLFIEFPNQVINLIDIFVSNYCPQIYNHDFLLHKLKQQIDKKPTQMSDIIAADENDKNMFIQKDANDIKINTSSDCFDCIDHVKTPQILKPDNDKNFDIFFEFDIDEF